MILLAHNGVDDGDGPVTATDIRENAAIHPPPAPPSPPAARPLVSDTVAFIGFGIAILLTVLLPLLTKKTRG